MKPAENSIRRRSASKNDRKKRLARSIAAKIGIAKEEGAARPGFRSETSQLKQARLAKNQDRMSQFDDRPAFRIFGH